MMTKHLPEILASRLNVQHKHLLKPKRHLNQIISLEKPMRFDLGIICPHLLDILPILTIHDNVESNQKGNGVVRYAPGLFGEASGGTERGVRCATVKDRGEDVAHEDGTKESEEKNECGDKEPIARSLIEQLSSRVEMREGKELGSVGLRNDDVDRR